MIYRYATFIKAINLTIDYAVVNISMILSYFVVDKSFTPWISNKNYFSVVLVFNLVWLLAANLTGLYEHVLNKDSVKTLRVVFRAYLTFVSVICFLIIVIIGTKAYFVSREFLFYSLAFFGILLGGWKFIFLVIRKNDRNILVEARKVIIVGAGRIGLDLFDYFQQNPDKGYRVMGFFDDNVNNIEGNAMYLGGTDVCIDYVISNSVNEIFCALPVTESNKIEHLMLSADKHLIRFKIIPEYYISASKSMMTVQNFEHIPVISLRPEPLESMLNRFIKRLFDIFLSLFAIIFVFSWLFPILAIIIKATSKGPVFFTQTRSGRDNKPFQCFKFRSMYVNKDSDKVQATRGDKRITPIGAFMRKTNLDEMPQFFNVLIGNMSAVGPRPHMLSHTEEYSKLIDQFMVRHFMKPGITGWAQVNGHRGETKTTDDMLKRVEADVWYLENWSFLLDLKIIFLTFWNVVKGEDNAF